MRRLGEAPGGMAGLALQFGVAAAERKRGLRVIEPRSFVPSAAAMALRAVLAEAGFMDIGMATRAVAVEGDPVSRIGTTGQAQGQGANAVLGSVAVRAFYRSVTSLQGPTGSRVIESSFSIVAPVDEREVTAGVFGVTAATVGLALPGVQAAFEGDRAVDPLVALPALEVEFVAAAVAVPAVPYPFQFGVSSRQRTRRDLCAGGDRGQQEQEENLERSAAVLDEAFRHRHHSPPTGHPCG